MSRSSPWQLNEFNQANPGKIQMFDPSKFQTNLDTAPTFNHISRDEIDSVDAKSTLNNNSDWNLGSHGHHLQQNSYNDGQYYNQDPNIHNGAQPYVNTWEYSQNQTPYAQEQQQQSFVNNDQTQYVDPSNGYYNQPYTAYTQSFDEQYQAQNFAQYNGFSGGDDQSYYNHQPQQWIGQSDPQQDQSRYDPSIQPHLQNDPTIIGSQQFYSGQPAQTPDQFHVQPHIQQNLHAHVQPNMQQPNVQIYSPVIGHATSPSSLNSPTNSTVSSQYDVNSYDHNLQHSEQVAPIYNNYAANPQYDQHIASPQNMIYNQELNSVNASIPTSESYNGGLSDIPDGERPDEDVNHEYKHQNTVESFFGNDDSTPSSSDKVSSSATSSESTNTSLDSISDHLQTVSLDNTADDVTSLDSIGEISNIPEQTDIPLSQSNSSTQQGLKTEMLSQDSAVGSIRSSDASQINVIRNDTNSLNMNSHDGNYTQNALQSDAYSDRSAGSQSNQNLGHYQQVNSRITEPNVGAFNHENMSQTSPHLHSPEKVNIYSPYQETGVADVRYQDRGNTTPRNTDIINDQSMLHGNPINTTNLRDANQAGYLHDNRTDLSKHSDTQSLDMSHTTQNLHSANQLPTIQQVDNIIATNRNVVHSSQPQTTQQVQSGHETYLQNHTMENSLAKKSASDVSTDPTHLPVNIENSRQSSDTDTGHSVNIFSSPINTPREHSAFHTPEKIHYENQHAIDPVSGFVTHNPISSSSNQNPHLEGTSKAVEPVNTSMYDDQPIPKATVPLVQDHPPLQHVENMRKAHNSTPTTTLWDQPQLSLMNTMILTAPTSQTDERTQDKHAHMSRNEPKESTQGSVIEEREDPMSGALAARPTLAFRGGNQNIPRLSRLNQLTQPTHQQERNPSYQSGNVDNVDSSQSRNPLQNTSAPERTPVAVPFDGRTSNVESSQLQQQRSILPQTQLPATSTQQPPYDQQLATNVQRPTSYETPTKSNSQISDDIRPASASNNSVLNTPTSRYGHHHQHNQNQASAPSDVPRTLIKPVDDRLSQQDPIYNNDRLSGDGHSNIKPNEPVSDTRAQDPLSRDTQISSQNDPRLDDKQNETYRDNPNLMNVKDPKSYDNQSSDNRPYDTRTQDLNPRSSASLDTRQSDPNNDQKRYDPRAYDTNDSRYPRRPETYGYDKQSSYYDYYNRDPYNRSYDAYAARPPSRADSIHDEYGMRDNHSDAYRRDSRDQYGYMRGYVGDEYYDRPRSRAEEYRPSSRSGYDPNRPQSRTGQEVERSNSRTGYEDARTQRQNSYDYRQRSYSTNKEYYDQYYYEQDYYQRQRYNRGYYDEMGYYKQQYGDRYQEKSYQTPSQPEMDRRGSISSSTRGSISNSRSTTPAHEVDDLGDSSFARDFRGYDNRGHDNRPSSRQGQTGQYEESPIYPVSRQYSAYSDYYSQYYNSSYYNNYYRQQAKVAPALAVPKFSLPHIAVQFTSSGHLITVLPNRPADGQTAGVEVHETETLLVDSPQGEELRLFPGPLIKGETHKNDVLVFCQTKARECREDVNSVDRESAELIWKYLELLIKQNGTVVGTDIADLLLQGHEPTSSELKAGGLCIDTTNDVADDTDATCNTTFDRSIVQGKNNTVDSVTDRFRHLLLYGRKKDSLEWAMKNNLWGHALFLASKMDTRAHANVMIRFANSSMHINDPLQTLYQLMSGRQPAAVTGISDEKWGDWRPHLAMVLSNTSDRLDINRKSIVTLGDTLASRGCLHASHFCYLVASVSMGTYTQKSAKWVLIGSSHNTSLLEFASNLSVQCTEVYEYARNLGNDNSTLANFQAYKFMYACRLAEYGYTSEAFHYCEVIASVIQKSPGLYNTTLVSQLYQMSERLKYCDPERQNAAYNSADPLWLSQLASLYQAFKEGKIQAVPPSHTPSDPNPTTASSESGDVAALTSSDTSLAQYMTGRQSADYSAMSAVHPGFQAYTQQTQEYGYTQEAYNQQDYSQQTGYDQSAYNQNTPIAADYTDYPAQQLPNQTNQIGYGYGQMMDPTVNQIGVDQSQANQGYYTGAIEEHHSDHGMSSTAATYDAAQQGYYNPTSTGYMQPTQNALEPTQEVNAQATTVSENFDYFAASTQHAYTGKVIGPRRRRNTSESSAASGGSVKAAPRPKPAPLEKSSKPNVKNDKKATDDGNKKGFLGGLFSGFSFRAKNQMNLPDDKNPTIIWDDKKKRWVNTDADDETEIPSAPPPKDIELTPSHGNTPPLLNTPGGNRFQRQKVRGAHGRYVDVLNKENKPATTSDIPPSLFNVMPSPSPTQNIFTPGGHMTTQATEPVTGAGVPPGTVGHHLEVSSIPQYLSTDQATTNQAPPPPPDTSVVASQPSAMPLLFDPSQFTPATSTPGGQGAQGPRYGQRRQYPR